jgi:CoA-transferase family III
MMMTTQFNVLATGWHDRPAERMGGGLKVGKFRTRFVYPCKDGHVSITFSSGPVLGGPTRRLFEWIHERGFCDEATRDKDWIRYGGLLVCGKEPLEEYRCMDCIEGFTLSQTKTELFEEALRRPILLVPVSNTADMVHARQLEAREYWTSIEHPELGREVVYPGPFAKLSETPLRYRRRPPLLGEHTSEIAGERSGPQRVRPGPSQARLRKCARRPQGTGFHLGIRRTGPGATRYLADYGATVVRIESSKKLDTYRTVGPFKDGRSGLDRSAGFSNANMGKYDVSLNLAVSEAREIALRLVKGPT